MTAWVEIPLLLAIGMFPIYLAFLSILALFYRDKKIYRASFAPRFAVIIPAHNEEFGIAATIKSILAVDYPREKFDVIVVADNCTDNTAAIALSEGAIVHERRDPAHAGKGYALSWCFAKLMENGRGYDSFVIIDADSEASENLLDVLAWYRQLGSRAIQVADVVAPSPGVWNSEIIRLGFTLYNVARPLGRAMIGCSAGLRGNGMCIAVKTLRTVPWEAFSITEDLEYGLMLLLHGVKVDFAPEARVLAIMPANPKNSETQRSRWETGRLPLIRRYTSRLFFHSLRHCSFVSFDALVDLVMPPFVNLVAVIFGVLFIHLCLSIIGAREAGTYAMLWSLAFAGAIVHAIAGLIAAKADAGLYSSIAHVPRYAVWKVKLYLSMLWKSKSEVWVRTTREPAADRRERFAHDSTTGHD